MIEPQNIPWSEKYRPKNFKDIKGQELAVSGVKLFLEKFPKKRALILHGTPGTGKTSLAYAIASDMDAEILELNASDFRNKEKIESIITPASKQQSLFRRNKIILVDEVDGISSIKDRGGLTELIDIIENTSFPIIITANDIWKKDFNDLRSKSEVVQLKEVDYKVIREILEITCKKEDCVVSNDVLTSIAIKSRGDIRAALNDLQILSKSESKDLIKEVGDRNKEQSIFQAMQYIFKNSKIDNNMLKIFDEVNMPLDEIFLWVEENIPLEYSGQELYKAFDLLSLADVYRGRIRRNRHWRFLVYQSFLLGPAIASVKKNNRSGWVSYRKPSRILKIWLQNQRSLKKKSICKKYAVYCHISTKTAMKDFMVLKMILKDEKIRNELKLSEEEVAYLDKPI